MNRLDKIKNDFHCAKFGEVHGDTDIQYLLSIIEQAEKALEKAERNFRSMLCDGLADDVQEALKSIQGEG